MEIIENSGLRSRILTDAAVVREREHGLREYLLLMRLMPVEALPARFWTRGLAIAAAILSLQRSVAGLPTVTPFSLGALMRLRRIITVVQP